MSAATILVIDDERDLVELVRYNLEKAGHEVIAASNGQEGLGILSRHRIDLVILDLMMPGIDGLEVCRRLRGESRTARIPIIMLTARATEADKVVGLELGADDYVVKPFSPRELDARVGAVLRRYQAQQEAPEIVHRGDLVIDIGRHEVTWRGQPVALTATEFRILHFLASRPGRLVSRDDILDGAMGRDSAVLDRTIDVHITAIRRKLGPGGECIETVRGFGYKFREEGAGVRQEQ